PRGEEGVRVPTTNRWTPKRPAPKQPANSRQALRRPAHRERDERRTGPARDRARRRRPGRSRARGEAGRLLPAVELPAARRDLPDRYDGDARALHEAGPTARAGRTVSVRRRR